MRMTPEQYNEKINELIKEIENEPKFSKRWVFLAATINSYRKETGKPELKKYTW